jgi:sterol 14-demethylase
MVLGAASEAANSSLLPYILASAGIFLISYLSLLRRKAFDRQAPPVTRANWPIFGDFGFWTARHEFWLAALNHARSGNFSFHIGKHRAVGTNSDEGRKLFFESKELDFGEG